MSFWSFLRDRIIFIGTAVAAAIFAYYFVCALGCGDYAGKYIAGLILLAQGTALILEYLRRRGFYASLKKSLAQLDRKYLLSELLETPSFEEGRVLCETVRATGKSMTDEIAGYRRASQEYREYIEAWVHEVKTPISSSRLILENNPGEISQSLREDMDKIEDYVEQALFYSRSNTLEKDYIISEVTLKALTSSALKKHSALLIEAGVSLRTEGLDLTVHTDDKWTDFILGQILTNAVKYRGVKPEIRITGRQLKNGVSLTIADNGIGIPEKDLPRVFEKSFTGTNGRIGAKSTGLGLYLCKKLCGKMGIDISAVSHLGTGTAIKLIFPESSMYR